MPYNENDTALYIEIDPNDRDNFKITKDDDFINSDAQLSGVTEDVVSNLIDATYDVMDELIKQYDNSGAFGKTFTAGQIAIVGLTYKTLTNLKDERITNGDVGFRDELVAVGQTLGEGIFSGTAALAGRFIPTTTNSPGKNFLKKAGADIALGVVAGEVYEELKIPGTDSTSKDLVGDLLRGTYNNLRDFFFSENSSNKTLVTDNEKNNLNNLDGFSEVIITNEEEQSLDNYSIKPGDTISQISQNFGISEEQIINNNQFLIDEGRISNNGNHILIKPGEKLSLVNEQNISDLKPISSINNSSLLDLVNNYKIIDNSFFDNFIKKYDSILDNDFLSDIGVEDPLNFNFDTTLAIPDVSDILTENLSIKDDVKINFLNSSSGNIFNQDFDQFLDSLNLKQLTLLEVSSDLDQLYGLKSLGNDNSSLSLKLAENWQSKKLNLNNDIFSVGGDIDNGSLNVKISDNVYIEADWSNPEFEQNYYGDYSFEISYNYEIGPDIESHLDSLSDIYSPDEVTELVYQFYSDYEFINDDWSYQLQRDQEDFVENLNDDINQFILDNPLIWRNEIDDFVTGYDNDWSSMNDSIIDLWFSEIDGLISDYSDLEFYDLDSVSIDVADYDVTLEHWVPGYDSEHFSFDDWYGVFDDNNNGYIDVYEYYTIDFMDMEDYVREEMIDSGFYVDDWENLSSDIEDGFWSEDSFNTDYFLSGESYTEIIANAEVFYDTQIYELPISAMDNALYFQSYALDLDWQWQPSDIDFEYGFNGSFEDELEDLTRYFEQYDLEVGFESPSSIIYDNSKHKSLSYNFVDLSSNAPTNQNDIIASTTNSVIINAGDGFDIINGSNQDDVLNGEAGDDLLIGNAGNDILNGGPGADSFVFFSNQLFNSTINDDNGFVIVDNKVIAGLAQQQDISNFYNLGDKLIELNDRNLTINLTNGSKININEFSNGDFGINLNDNPVINLTEIQGTLNQEHIIDIISSTSDSEENITLHSITHPQNGEAQIVEGKIQYTPNHNFIGIDNLQYLVGDGNGGFINKNLEIKTLPTNNENISDNKQNYTGNEDESLQILVFANIDKDLFSSYNLLNDKGYIKQRNIAIIANSAIVSYDEETGFINYNPKQNFNGLDELRYNIMDNDGNILDSKIVDLAINSINDIPAGAVKNHSVNSGQQFTINLNDYFSDADGDDLTYLVNAKNQIGLPSFIKFNEITNELTGQFNGRGALEIEVIASDGFGGIYQNSFKIQSSNSEAPKKIIDLPEVREINGTDSNDNIQAITSQQDFISAGAGDDEIAYTQDNVWQDSGSEQFFAWNVYSGDMVSVNGKQQSFDSFDGGTGNDTLNLTDENDVLFLDDPVTSSLSNSARISGIEIINGGLGDDIIDLSSLNYEYGDVELNGGVGDDVLWSNSGDDTLNGGGGNDNIQAGSGNDILNGDAGDDVLKGYDGNDILTGGAGLDTLTGGFGFDSFNFTALDESTINSSDLITDFTQGDDSINLSNFSFTAIQEGEGSSAILGYSYDQENDITTIEDSESDFAIQLSGKVDLANDDFNF